MGRKETVIVAILFSLTTMLKIFSVVALYHTHKVNDTAYQRSIYLTHNSIKNNLLCADEGINAEPQADLGFQQTVAAHR